MDTKENSLNLLSGIDPKHSNTPVKSRFAQPQQTKRRNATKRKKSKAKHINGNTKIIE